MRTYADILSHNPVMQHSVDGYQRDKWYNAVQKPMGGVINYNIKVFANSAQEAQFYAKAFKHYIEANPLITRGIKDDISIGMTKPVLDTHTRAYVVDLIMMAGQLRMFGSSSVPTTPTTPHNEHDVVYHGMPVTYNGKQLTY